MCFVEEILYENYPASWFHCLQFIYHGTSARAKVKSNLLRRWMDGENKNRAQGSGGDDSQ